MEYAHEVASDPHLQYCDQSACRSKDVDGKYDTHTTCTSVISVKIGDGKC